MPVARCIFTGYEQDFAINYDIIYSMGREGKIGMYEHRNRADGLRPEILRIFRTVGLESHYSEILRIGNAAVSDGESALRDLMLIDETIPGLGQHNINEITEGGSVIAVARIEDRPICRPIQYVGMYLQGGPIEWLTRNIVTMSCLHVENSLKRQLKIDGPLSVGMILHRGKARALDADLVEFLWELNEAVYNKSKHTIERTYADGHMFSIADSLAVYLICRTLGARILRDSGITTKYDEPVFDEKIPVASRQLTK